MPINDDTVIWFGKHATEGKKLKDVPDSYFIWLYGQDWFEDKYPELYDYVVKNASSFPDLLLKGKDKDKWHAPSIVTNRRS